MNRMDHGLLNQRYKEQEQNLKQGLLGQYIDGVKSRMSGLLNNPAQALYGAYSNQIGVNLDRPVAEYAAMAKNPQRGLLDPNAPAMQEVMGWLPGPADNVAGLLGVTKKLPMDEASRMQRAKEMGFDFDFYHGTTADIDKFVGGDIGTHVGTFEQANNRITDLARQRGEIPGYGGSGLLVENANILPIKARLQRSLELPDVGMWNDSEKIISSLEDLPEFRGKFDNAWEELGVKDQFENIEDWINSPENREMLEEIKEELVSSGYDSVKYKNVVENEYGNLPDLTPSAKAERYILQKRQDEIHKLNSSRRPPIPEDVEKIQAWLDAGDNFYTNEELMELDEIRSKLIAVSEETNDPYSHIILNPKNIRSKFAKFDPSKAESSNLIAGLSALGIGAGLLAPWRENERTD